MSEASSSKNKSAMQRKRKATPASTAPNGSTVKSQKITETHIEDSIADNSKSLMIENPANGDKEKYDWNAEADGDDEDETVKWKTLEHHGVSYSP